MAYELSKDAHTDWKRTTLRDAPLTPRQQVVVDAVQACLADGLYYTKDVFRRAVELLKPSPDQLAFRATKVEGGEVGMDFYYARKVVEARTHRQAEDALRETLCLATGESPGVLVFNDGKRVNATRIVAADLDGVTVEGKRGALTVRASSIGFAALQRAIDRAFDKGYRKDSFEAFRDGRVAALALQQPQVLQDWAGVESDNEHEEVAETSQARERG